MSVAVVWDVGNVLIRWEPRRLWRRMFEGEDEMEAFLERTGFEAWNLEQDRGRAWADGLAAIRVEHPHAAERYERFAADWHEAVPGAIEGSVAILRRQRAAGVALYALTNFSAEKWAECRDRFDFLADAFDDAVVSAHEGMVKPDPALFGVLCRRAGRQAEELVLIDDGARNVEAAEGLGIDAIRFESPGQVLRALQRRGLPA